MDLDGPIQISYHLPDEGELLDILPPKAGGIGLHQMEEFGDNGEYAGKMARTSRSFPPFRARPGNNPDFRTGWVHRLHRGDKQCLHPASGSHRAVARKIARITPQVVARAELQRVDEDAHDHPVG